MRTITAYVICCCIRYQGCCAEHLWAGGDAAAVVCASVSRAEQDQVVSLCDRKDVYAWQKCGGGTVT